MLNLEQIQSIEEVAFKYNNTHSIHDYDGFIEGVTSRHMVFEVTHHNDTMNLYVSYTYNYITKQVRAYSIFIVYSDNTDIEIMSHKHLRTLIHEFKGRKA